LNCKKLIVACLAALAFGNASAETERDRLGEKLLDAASLSHLKEVATLLRRGADPNYFGSSIAGGKGEKSSKITPLLCAVGGAEPLRYPQKDGTYLVHTRGFRLASSRGKLTPVVRLLLSKGARVDQRGYTGRTALMWAAFDLDASLVRVLLEFKASKELKDANGQSALDLAGGDPVISKLLQK